MAWRIKPGLLAPWGLVLLLACGAPDAGLEPGGPGSNLLRAGDVFVAGEMAGQPWHPAEGGMALSLIHI